MGKFAENEQKIGSIFYCSLTRCITHLLQPRSSVPRMPLICDPLPRRNSHSTSAIHQNSFRTLQPRGQWGAVRKSLQELIESASPAAVQAKASRCIGLDAGALRKAAEYLQLQYRKLHESEEYLSPGEWERRSRLVTIKVTDVESEALSSLAEVTGLTKRVPKSASAGK